jgi:hypothetical protein
MAAAAGIIAAAPLTLPVAHADPSRCDQFHDPHLRHLCLGDMAEMPAETTPTTTQTVPSWNPCYSTGLNAQGQECTYVPGG